MAEVSAMHGLRELASRTSDACDAASKQADAIRSRSVYYRDALARSLMPNDDTLKVMLDKANAQSCRAQLLIAAREAEPAFALVRNLLDELDGAIKMLDVLSVCPDA